MKKLLILEKDHRLERDRHSSIFKFLRTWEGEVVEFTGLDSKTDLEIYRAVLDCTDILSQTCFVNGSEAYFYHFVRMLPGIKESKNIYIDLLGSDLYEYIDDELTDAELLSISHHNIFSYKRGYPDDKMIKLDFSTRVNRELNRIKYEKEYKEKAINRRTGSRIKILGCNGSGTPFRNLPIGAEVDELDMRELDPNPTRGVWIMGNGEPIKLVNDCGMQEYELIVDIKSNEDRLNYILKEIGHYRTDVYDIEIVKEQNDLLEIISCDDHNMSKANSICEYLDIPKRSNRQRIYELLNK